LIFNNLRNKWYRLGILTNWPWYITYKKLLSANINPFIFDFIVHMDNNPYPKPSNNIFKINLKHYISKYSNTYLIWDSIDDYHSTLWTKVEFYWVTTWFHDKTDFKKHGLLDNNILWTINEVVKLF
jgi:FMN phosphatase YigB (HAD superfamily)